MAAAEDVSEGLGVSGSLTPGLVTSVDEMAASRRRHPATYEARLVFAASLDDVGEAGRALLEAESVLWQAVGRARAGGVPWALIGATLGVSRQSAQARFAKPPRGRLV